MFSSLGDIWPVALGISAGRVTDEEGKLYAGVLMVAQGIAKHANKYMFEQTRCSMRTCRTPLE